VRAASHNIVAFRCKDCSGKTPVLQADCDDDGESAAGGRLLQLLENCKVMDVVVVVTRWYGGTHLGPARFKHINNAARLLLDEHGYVRKKG